MNTIKTISLTSEVSTVSEVPSVSEVSISNFEVESNLEMIVKKYNLTVHNSSVKIDVEKIKSVLTGSVFSTPTFRKLHQCSVKLLDTRNEGIINFVNSCSKDELKKYMIENYNNISLYNFKREGKSLSGLSLGAYGGNKSNFNSHQQYVINDILSQNPNIDTYVDGFMGMLGSFFSVLPILHKNNISSILNDYNSKTINMWNRVKNNVSEVKNIISDVVNRWYFEFGGFDDFYFDNTELQKKVHKDLLEVVQEKERKGELDVIHATYLLILANIPFTGNYEVKVEKENRVGKTEEEIEIEKMKGNTVSTYSVSRDPKKFMYVVNRLIKKVDTISMLLNIGNVEFTNMDYKKVIDLYDGSNTIVLLDPPYVECHLEYEEKPDFVEVKSCSYNYGLNWKTKEHLDVLETVSNLKGEVMYWNYKHTVVKHYQMKNNFKEIEINFKDGTTNIDKINYLMWSNKMIRNNVNLKTYEKSNQSLVS